MKPKVLILYNKLLHYRIPIFKILGEQYDLTVAYNYGGIPKEALNFKYVKLTPYNIWKFTFQKENIFQLCQNFDAVISYGQTSYLKYSFLALHRNRKFKLAYWSIGAPASYTRKYGEGSWLYFAFTNFFPKRADAQISYAEAGRGLHIKHGFDPEHLFVADNTVEVIKIQKERPKESIMFIGTLYPQKGLPILLEAYKNAYSTNPNIPTLEIVGDGPIKRDTEDWIKRNGLCDRIIMHGAIYSSDEKSKIFSKALACISPNQAGLGVLESMGYGVPFITSVDAITGGESFNIKNGINGLRLDSIDNLSDVIVDIANNPKKYDLMGQRAYDYYWSYRTPQHMADGLSEAINFMLDKR